MVDTTAANLMTGIADFMMGFLANKRKDGAIRANSRTIRYQCFAYKLLQGTLQLLLAN